MGQVKGGSKWQAQERGGSRKRWVQNEVGPGDRFRRPRRAAPRPGPLARANAHARTHAHTQTHTPIGNPHWQRHKPIVGTKATFHPAKPDQTNISTWSAPAGRAALTPPRFLPQDKGPARTHAVALRQHKGGYSRQRTAAEENNRRQILLSGTLHTPRDMVPCIHCHLASL